MGSLCTKIPSDIPLNNAESSTEPVVEIIEKPPPERTVIFEAIPPPVTIDNPQPIIVENPLARPQPGDIVKFFDSADYMQVTETYQNWLPTSDTFSDEDIVCVIAVLTVENRLTECIDPSWTLTKTRRISEREIKKRVQVRLDTMRQLINESV